MPEIKDQILINHPFFHDWPVPILSAFTQAMTKVSFARGDTLVKQNEVVDSIYFIASGQAEVNIDSEEGTSILAVLKPGETIGLGMSGFFSQQGVRTANVLAVEDVTVYKLLISDIDSILKTFPNFKHDFIGSVDLRLKMNLIKQAAPFATLSGVAIHELANQILTVFVSKNQVLFHQGDEGDNCYIICSGTIAIELEHNGATQCLNTLTSAQVFGETALLMSSKRTATAKALTECKLFALPKRIFLNFVTREHKSAESFIALMLEYSDMSVNTNVVTSEITSASEDKILVLKNRENFEYFQLSDYGISLWQLLSSNHDIREIIQIINQEYKTVTIEEIKDLIIVLAEDGFIKLRSMELETEAAHLKGWSFVITKIKELMEIHYTFHDTDQWITKTYEGGVKYLFSKISIYLFTLIGIAGLIAFVYISPQAFLLSQSLSISTLIIIVIIGALTVIPHELGHAYMTKAYGREVNYFGIGWYWAGPIAFTDTTDMWLSPRRERLAVDIAGNYVNFVLAGILAMIALVANNPTVFVVCWMLSLVNYFAIYMNLDSLLELDGYYLLMDYLDEPNLREDAVVWLVETFPTCLRNPSLFKKHKKEIIYWLVSIGFVISRILIAIFLQQFILNRFSFFSLHANLEWIFPVAVGLLSLVSVWVDARKRIASHKK